MENREPTAVLFKSGRQKEVKVVLEFAGKREEQEVERQFADVLTQAYLEKMRKGEET